jgi:hypothetical protein
MQLSESNPSAAIKHLSNSARYVRLMALNSAKIEHALRKYDLTL